MKIGIMGSGGLGGFFEGWLAASGVDVSFIARGEHLDAMRANGLTVTSQLGDIIPLVAGVAPCGGAVLVSIREMSLPRAASSWPAELIWEVTVIADILRHGPPRRATYR